MSKNVLLKPFKPGNKFKEWKIVEPVGEISDNGAAYKVLKENLPYLLVIQKIGHDEILNYEIHVLQEMTKVFARHILKIEEKGQFYYDFSYVVLTLVGKTLNDLREYAPNNKFSRGTAVLIAIKCLQAIEDFHANGFFLRDIKPSNFAIGRSEFGKLREIYLKNVYMAKKNKNHDGNVRDVFWPPKPRLHLRYAPIAYHQQQKIRFIDEIESWFYMIVEWTCGKLPWKHLKDTNHDEILRMKEDFLTDGEQFLDDCPQEYHQILWIISATKGKDDELIYEQIFSLLYEATKNVQLHPFDWEIWQMKQKKRKEKFEKVKNVSSFDWQIRESRLNEMEFSPGACETTTYKYIGEKKEIKYFVELFPRGIPNTKYQYGSWIILKLFNNTLDTNVEAKYTVKIPYANYTKKCHHIFEKNEEWEMNGLKICELFNPKKKYFFNGFMNLKFEFEFIEFEKESEEKLDFADEVDFAEEVSEEKTVWTFPLTWDIPVKQLKAKFKQHECLNSTKYFVKNQFEFCFKIFPNLLGYSIEKGAWIFLYFKNLNEENFIETKYTVSVEKAKYQRESRHFFKQFNQWETDRIKIDELFDKKLLTQKEKEIQIKFKISFAKDIKEIQDENDQIEDFSVHEFDNLAFLPESSEADDNKTLLTSEATITAKDIYFPPTDLWLKNQCDLIGIQFYKNISKFRPPIDDIQKFTILKPDDIIGVDGDGKCGYRALSVLLCGNDCYHLCIKRMICKMIRENMDPKFEEMYIFKDARQNAARKLMFDPPDANDKRFWMDDSDLATAANLFDCNIFVLTQNKEWQCYAPKTFENGIMDSFVNFDSKLPTLLLENSGGNHFSPVKNVRLKWW